MLAIHKCDQGPFFSACTVARPLHREGACVEAQHCCASTFFNPRIVRRSHVGAYAASPHNDSMLRSREWQAIPAAVGVRGNPVAPRPCSGERNTVRCALTQLCSRSVQADPGAPAPLGPSGCGRIRGNPAPACVLPTTHRTPPLKCSVFGGCNPRVPHTPPPCPFSCQGRESESGVAARQRNRCIAASATYPPLPLRERGAGG